MNYILAIGSLKYGTRFEGPFRTHDDAVSYAEEWVHNSHWEIIKVEKPCLGWRQDQSAKWIGEK